MEQNSKQQTSLLPLSEDQGMELLPSTNARAWQALLGRAKLLCKTAHVEEWWLGLVAQSLLGLVLVDSERKLLKMLCWLIEAKVLKILLLSK